MCRTISSQRGRQPALVAVVEPRRHRALDQLVERRGLQVVAAVGVVDAVRGRDRPAVLAVVPLVPPAVEDREVQAAVQRRLHARTCRTPRTGAAGCSARRRSPGRASAPSRCRSSAGTRSGGGPPGRRRTSPSAGSAACRCRRPGATCRRSPAAPAGSGAAAAPSAARGSRSIRVSRLYVGTRRAKPIVSTSGSRTSSTQPSSAWLAPRLSHDARTRRRASSHQRLRASAGAPPRPPRRAPGRPPPRPCASLVIRGADVPLPQLEHPAVDPGRGVHAVRDRGDRHLVGVEARPQAVEHLPADHAVQLGDAVGPLRQPQPHDRHVEHRRVAAGVVLGAEREDPLDRHAGAVAVAAEVGRRSGRGRTGRCRPAPGCGW